MRNYENTFVRDPSPSYSDEILSSSTSSSSSSENALSETLPIGGTAELLYVKTENEDDYFDKNLNNTCDKNFLYSQSMYQDKATFAFWTVVTVLFILTIGNLILTLTIIGVLRLGKGIQGMELIPEEDIIKFYGITDLDRIYMKNVGHIDGFTNEPVTVTGDNGPVHVRVYKNGVLNDRIVLDKEGIVVRATNLFEVKDPSDKTQIFSTHRPQYNIPSGAETLIAKAVSASRIASSIDQPLSINAEGKILIKGSEGIGIEAAATLLQAEHYIALNSSQGATILEGGLGIFLDMTRVPIVSSELGLRSGSVQFKICVCMPQGYLYRIAIPIPRLHNGPKVSCAHYNPKEDPCLIK